MLESVCKSIIRYQISSQSKSRISLIKFRPKTRHLYDVDFKKVDLLKPVTLLAHRIEKY